MVEGVVSSDAAGGSPPKTMTGELKLDASPACAVG